MTKVVGIFNNRMDGERAVSSLVSAGFEQNEISLLMSDKARSTLFESSDDVEGELDATDQVAKGTATGALIGGALGAIGAGLVAVGSIVVPGSALLVAGPIVAALSGAGAGAAAGGLAGALVGAGFGVDEANRYEEEIKRGKVMIVVDADGEVKRTTAQQALTNAGATIKAA